MKSKLDLPLQILLALVLFLLFISSSVFLTLAFKPLYYIDMNRLNIVEESELSLTAEEIRHNYDVLIDYNLPLRDGELEFPDLPMSEHGKQHFAEVKDIFDIFKVIAIVAIPLSAAGIYYFHERKKKTYLLLTSIFTIAIPIVVGSLIALCWDKVFVKFHEIFFDNDYWIFDYYEDPVIRILPDEFFMHCAVMIIALAVTEGLICGIVYFVKRKKSKA